MNSLTAKKQKQTTYINIDNTLLTGCYPDPSMILLHIICVQNYELCVCVCVCVCVHSQAGCLRLWIAAQMCGSMTRGTDHNISYSFCTLQQQRQNNERQQQQHQQQQDKTVTEHISTSCVHEDNKSIPKVDYNLYSGKSK